jgi:hypothetical protein
MNLNVGIFYHPKRPKIPEKDIVDIVKSLDLKVSESPSSTDIALVIGGDGTFSYYGRSLSAPLLFVGISDPDILGSKNNLSTISFKSLFNALKQIKKGNYKIVNRKMISVKYSNFKPVDVLTDIYVERGIFAGCIRYTISVSKNVTKDNVDTVIEEKNQKTFFTDYVIGNGVIISTAFGSTGYYAYVDRIINSTNQIKSELFDDNKIGICHILPNFAVRKKANLKKETFIRHIHYTIPFESLIKINVIRNANVRLYGTTNDSKGIAVETNTPIIISPSKKIAKIITLNS